VTREECASQRILTGRQRSIEKIDVGGDLAAGHQIAGIPAL
jgi:hypothetical protein